MNSVVSVWKGHLWIKERIGSWWIELREMDHLGRSIVFSSQLSAVYHAKLRHL